MPQLPVPLLELDTDKLGSLNPRNVESLFSLWTVFSKCSSSIPEGRRYENLSWRLWNRETFCCPPQPQFAITPAIDIKGSRPGSKDIPGLSASVESAVSDKSNDTACPPSSKPQLIPRASLKSEDSALSRSRGNEEHLTTLGLKKLVGSIQDTTELGPLSPRIEATVSKMIDVAPVVKAASLDKMQASTGSEFSTTSAATDSTARQSEHRNSDTSVSDDGLIRSGSVVHGFSPSQLAPSFRAKSRLSQSISASPRHSSQLAPKKGGIFTLGGSSGDDESSFEERMSFRPQRSRLSEGLARPAEIQKKVPSFRDIVQARQQETKHNSEQDEDAIESDDDDISDSAIEDDEEEEGDWEDEVSVDERQPLTDSALFRRVGSRPDLVSRRSMLTLALHNPDSQVALANAASRSSPLIRRPRGNSSQTPSTLGSPNENDDGPGLTMLPSQATKSRPRPIITNASSSYAPANSPRTTRRNMLATELTESLRRNLLWERQQKNQTANAVFRRRHTAQNMTALQEYPGTNQPTQPNDHSRNNSWNHYLETPWEYHTKGW